MSKRKKKTKTKKKDPTLWHIVKSTVSYSDCYYQLFGLLVDTLILPAKLLMDVKQYSRRV